MDMLDKIVNLNFIIQISKLAKTIENWSKEISNVGITNEDKKMFDDAVDRLVGATRDLEKLNSHDRESRLAITKNAASVVEEVLYRTRIVGWLGDIKRRGLVAEDKEDIILLKDLVRFFEYIYINGNADYRLEESKEAARKVSGYWARVTEKSRLKESEKHDSLV